jgi:hypothetical protein
MGSQRALALGQKRSDASRSLAGQHGFGLALQVQAIRMLMSDAHNCRNVDP